MDCKKASINQTVQILYRYLYHIQPACVINTQNDWKIIECFPFKYCFRARVLLMENSYMYMYVVFLKRLK